MGQIRPELAGHPDRLRWNARYGGDYTPSFTPPALAVLALSMPLPPGPVLDLACGPSGSALLAAQAGRAVTAVDASDVALSLLAAEARQRELDGLISIVHADLHSWQPARAAYALVLCTGFWDRVSFGRAAAAVAARGLLGWEAFTLAARRDRPSLPEEWCLRPGEPASLLPPRFEVLSQEERPGGRRQLLARKAS
jgi:SAM-dependent methyltransferase